MKKVFVIAFLVVVLASETLSKTTVKLPKLLGSNQFAINDAFTGKEKCILKTLNMYKMHFLKFVLYHRAKEITQLYKLELSKRHFDRIRGMNRQYNDWQNSRGLTNQATKSFNKIHLQKFIKKMGPKMKIFGKLFTYKQLKLKYKTLKKLRGNWVSTIRRGRTFNVESSRAADIQNMLMHQFGLPKKYRMRLTHCKLNSKPLMDKCQNMYGSNTCEVLYSGVVHKKCPKGMERVGCCSCAPPCPAHHFKDDHYFCKPKKSYQLDLYSTLSECKLEQIECSKVEDKYTGNCKAGFERDAELPQCRAQCPQGWKEIKESCLKPGILSLGTPFVWDKSDN